MILILSDKTIGVDSSRNTGVEYATDEKPLLHQTQETALLGKVDGGLQ